MVNPRSFLDLLAATVDLATARSVLRELVRLADQAPGLTKEQRRFRLLMLAAYATPRLLAVPPIPGWPPVEPGPRLGSRRLAGIT
ncbi:MAG: hypothetical protein M3460_29425 [Actinomycetota bacterium]|nr:hypothetical protein [Actinomycetota bacterium]